MGDPPRQRSKFHGPSHPWQKARIDEEKGLKKDYGLANKREIWKAKSLLTNFTGQSKRLIAATSAQAAKEKTQLLQRLMSLGLANTNTKLEDVLTLSTKNILDRRLQTLAFKKGLARTVKQARQMIIHGHVIVGEKKITAPSYLVNIAEEGHIKFDQNSQFIDSMHPERVQAKPVAAEVKEESSEEATEEKSKEKKVHKKKEESKSETPKAEEKKEEPKTEAKE
jgi:small subunit ribosomal protein S4